MKTEHILTVCQRGNTRSVALARVLKDERNHLNVIACGVDTTDPETFAFLANWASRIFVVGEDYIYNKVPTEFRDKTTHFNIGEDHWGTPYVPELMALVRQKANEAGL